MRGAPGTGKSRFLRTVGADQENLIVSSDAVRQMLAATVMAGDGSGACSRGFGGRDGKLVWDFLHECVRQRARQGSDIFLDTCGITWDKVAREAAYCVKLGYELTVIDMQGDAPLDAVLDMQELRRFHPSYVDRATVAAMWEAVREGTGKIKDIVERRGGTYLTAEWRYNNAGAAPVVLNVSEMARIVNDKRANNGIVRLTATDDHPVVFVGDVHSDADRLNTVFQQILNRYGEGNATVVLLGDLFDRGPDPVGTKDLPAHSTSTSSSATSSLSRATTISTCVACTRTRRNLLTRSRRPGRPLTRSSPWGGMRRCCAPARWTAWCWVSLWSVRGAPPCSRATAA